MDKKKYFNIFLSIVGLFLICVSFFKQNLSYYRIILVVFGILIISLKCFLFNKRRFFPLLIILLIMFVFTLDGFISITFSRIPIFVYNIITIDNSRVYNAIGYRIWDCEGEKLKVDRFYKLGYYCDASKMEEINSNAFLGEVVDKFQDYKNRYIKINGKISRKEGINYIEMQPYQSNGITLNGYVTFSSEVTLRIVFKSGTDKLNGYDIYDNITVVGKIWYMRKENGNFIVYMDDSKVVDEMNYNNFEVLVSNSKNCEVDKKVLYTAKDYMLYSSCIDNIVVKFNDVTYEIGSVLSSGKLDINKILSVSNEINEENETAIIYSFDKYNIIKCNDIPNIIISSKEILFDKMYCE